MQQHFPPIASLDCSSLKTRYLREWQREDHGYIVSFKTHPKKKSQILLPEISGHNSTAGFLASLARRILPTGLHLLMYRLRLSHLHFSGGISHDLSVKNGNIRVFKGGVNVFSSFFFPQILSEHNKNLSSIVFSPSPICSAFHTGFSRCKQVQQRNQDSCLHWSWNSLQNRFHKAKKAFTWGNSSKSKWRLIRKMQILSYFLKSASTRIQYECKTLIQAVLWKCWKLLFRDTHQPSYSS